MTTKEYDRVKVIEQVVERRLTAVAAAQQLQLTSRHIGKYRDDGPQGLVSKQRGRRSNRSHTESFKQRVLKIYLDNYADFGPTLAAEKLQERHSCVVCVETPPMANRCRYLAKPSYAAPACLSATISARLLWRTDSDRWLSSRVV